VSRQGGDEFLIILGNIEDEEAAAAAAVKILAQLAIPFRVQGLDVAATGSLGVAMFPRDGADVDSLLKNSDMAMYRAKDCGRNTFQFFNVEMNNSVIEDLHLATGIRLALVNDEFSVHYQPQFDLKTGRIVGAEALLRWKHAVLGFVPPTKFIPVAERSGLINEIGAWVLNEACRQAKAWQDLGLVDLVVAVNVSPVQFRRDDIERELANALATWKVAPSSIELELTESLLMADSEHLNGVLDRLRATGVQLSIDDFGTGYSNLGYLKRFDVQRLKIDQSFVRRMCENKQDEGIVRAIIEMAHCLDLEVVAEGVEDAATLHRLVHLGCEVGQGYHWSPALPADQFLDFFLAQECL
jgi:predicted signal transduction protein with EAL and GGDEF domain